MDPATLTRTLKRRALEAGFDFAGVARAEPLERHRRALAAWLEGDRHATMAWLARAPETRSDPARLLEGCRSVVVLAVNYWPGEQRARTPDGKARVALYARGRDYHRVLGEKLKRLAAWLEESTGQPTRTFVDTGPVLERAWAEQAGVGWIGKNANLLSRELGSWLLLGEILAVATLVPDDGPHADFCGTCTACLDACPTGAIVEPGVVDSNLCISYWTIEHRGAVPAERRAGNGDWIFGCDVCQDVCPWNQQFAREAKDERLSFRDDLQGLDPEAILDMDEATFRARYSGTSLMRAKWEGMRRNACIVLGNRRRETAVPALARALEDDDPVVRSHAAWALGRIGGSEALHALGRAGRDGPRES
jgi:epoxyqueuosine reductase